MRNFPSSIEDKIVAPLNLARTGAARIFVCDTDSETTYQSLVVREPRSVRLAFRELGIEEALTTAESRNPQDDRDALLTLICLPSGARTSFELQKRAEGWMASRADERGAPYEVPYRSDRILWRRGRALCVGTGEFIGDVRDASASFPIWKSGLLRCGRQSSRTCP